MKLAIIDYPHALKSAVFGFNEMFDMANNICRQKQLTYHVEVDILNLEQLSKGQFNAVVLPPAVNDEFYFSPSSKLIAWLKRQHKNDVLLCSACAGTFILAATGLLDNRQAVTHWGLAESFKLTYPSVVVNSRKIIHCDGNLITAGGMMSWLDLGFELVSRLTNPDVMRQLGKNLVVDTGNREQRFYQQFVPNKTHRDNAVLWAQDYLSDHLASGIKVRDLAIKANLSERTFLRRFIQATNLRPNEYLQKLRIQKACDLLEATDLPFESIAWQVGYQDTGACRKTFLKIMGLTPKAFRQRFSR